MLPRVLLDNDRHKIDGEDWQRFCAAVEPYELPGAEAYSEAELVQALDGAAGLIKMGARLPDLGRSFFEALPDLRLVGVRGDRFGRGIDIEAAADCGVKIIDTDNIASSQPVAEWDLALMILCLRNGGAVFRQMMRGEEKWADCGNADYVSGELTGRRVGLVGLGHVGQRLVELLEPFGVDLLAHDPYVDEGTVERLSVKRAGLEAVLEHAEILVLQVPHTPKTEGMIGAAEFDRLGKGKIFINCSRGKVIDQDELIRRLEAGDLIAGLDVFDPEPLPKDSRLRTLPNVFATPHIAWNAPNALGRYMGTMLEEFVRFFEGQPLRYELTRRMVAIRGGEH